jgi:hypothetical protein
LTASTWHGRLQFHAEGRHSGNAIGAGGDLDAGITEQIISPITPYAICYLIVYYCHKIADYCHKAR